MYIFLKRLLRELFLGNIDENSNKMSKDELFDDQKIREKYGICTYILKLRDTDNALMMSGFACNFSLILGIGTIIALIVFSFCLGMAPPEQRWLYVFIPCAYIYLQVL